MLSSASRLAVGVLLLSCQSSDPSKPGVTEGRDPVVAVQVPAPISVAANRTALLEPYECNRCHAGTGLPEAAPDAQCVGCHRRILAGELDSSPESDEWKRNLVSLNVAPALRTVSKKFSAEWLRAFLLHPHDIRPALPASMPRLPLDDATARAIAEAMIPAEAPERAFPKMLAHRGAALFAELGCASCHAFGSTPAAPRVLHDGAMPTSDELALAPNLARTRERFQSGVLIPWLQNPQAIDPDTLMPNFNLDASQAESLAAFLWHTSEQFPTPALVAELPILKREVTWDEVNAKVFKTVCWHCHSEEDLAMGDGGAGNTGGFGYEGAGFDVSSYSSLRSGAIGDDGERHSVFATGQDGESLLIAVLLARRAEERGELSATLGMPLGFPSLTPIQLQLVQTWIAQGRPR